MPLAGADIYAYIGYGTLPVVNDLYVLRVDT